jgi:hypothetical protein
MVPEIASRSRKLVLNLTGSIPSSCNSKKRAFVPAVPDEYVEEEGMISMSDVSPASRADIKIINGKDSSNSIFARLLIKPR